MTEDPPETSLQDLDDRLKRLRQEQLPQGKFRMVGQPATGLGTAWLIAAHLVTGLAVGAGIGYLLDDWWGTKPAMMIVFFILGGVAGMRNVYRTAQGMAKTMARNAAQPQDEEKGPPRSGTDREETAQNRRG
jgi:ATP synthase protein I